MFIIDKKQLDNLLSAVNDDNTKGKIIGDLAEKGHLSDGIPEEYMACFEDQLQSLVDTHYAHIASRMAKNCGEDELAWGVYVMGDQYLSAGDVAIELGYKDKAKELFMLGVQHELQKGDSTSAHHAGSLAERAGDYELALKIYQENGSPGAVAPIAERLGRPAVAMEAYAAIGNYKKAANSARAAGFKDKEKIFHTLEDMTAD